MFNCFKLTHLPRISSDHSPFLLNSSNSSSFKHKIFHFENFWLEHEECLCTVRNALIFNAHSFPMHNFAHMLNRIKYSLQHVKALGVSALDSVIRDTELHLHNLETNDMNNPLLESEFENYRTLRNNYNALLRQNSISWAQRALLMWVQDGDRNSRFFHNSARIHNHNNRISSIINEEGLMLVDPDHIEDAFITFYSNLWADPYPNSFGNVLNAIPHDLSALSSANCDSLIKDISNGEIFYALNSLADGKSPGPDGFNVEFFKFFWDDIGDALFDVVRYFFSTAIMPRSLGNTYVTLIRKKEHSRKVSDFRPIFLCHVCYKIITKILANRLIPVLDTLISNEQSGFIAGPTPLDNIIAIQEIVHTINHDRRNPPRMLIKVDVEKAYMTL